MQDGYTQYICTDCGYYYRSDVTKFVSGTKFSVYDAVVGAGKKVAVTVSISDNPGIYSFTLGVNYDKNSMTLTDMKDLNNLGGSLTLGNNRILWLGKNLNNSDFNGSVFQLIFEVSPYASAQDYSVSLNTESDIVQFIIYDAYRVE